STFRFDFGRYDPSFARDFIYFQGEDEKKNDMCFVVPMSFFAEQQGSSTAPVQKTYTLKWFEENAKDKLTRVPGILVYQDLPTCGSFALQCTGQVWDEGAKDPTSTAFVPVWGKYT